MASPAELSGGSAPPDAAPPGAAAAGGGMLTPGRPQRLRRGRTRAPLPLQLVSAVLAALFGLPLVWLVIRSVSGDTPGTLTSTAGLRPLLNSVALAAATATATAIIGTIAAWLTVRTDLRWARLWQALLPLPLVVPSFIGAFTLLAAFAPGGLLDQLLPGGMALPRLGGFWGAFAVLTLLTYPYVFLPVSARMRQLPASLEESARLLGRGGWAAFRHVVLPQTRTAILAGALLVFLYTISDFGAVQLLRYDTLTRVIYATRLDQATSIALSLQLGLLAVMVVAGERLLVRASPPSGPRVARPLRVPLGRWQTPAVSGIVALVTLSLAAPVTVLGFWAVRGILQGSTRAGALAADPASLVVPLLSTVGAGVAAAAVAACIVLPLAYLTARHRGAVPAAANAVVVGGFALPGLVVALSLASFTLRGPGVVGGLYQSLTLLVLAYTVHFGAQTLRAAQVAVASVPPRVGDAARMLGAGGLRRIVTVDLPLMLPGLGAGAGLVMLSTMKELPATLLLAPPGFTTLATRIWNATEDAFWADASMASLVLVAISAVLTWVLVIRRFDALD